MPQEPSSSPEPQDWIKFLDPWMQDFYPVLGWGLAPVQGEHSSSQHPHWIKIDFPPVLVICLGKSLAFSGKIITSTG